MGLFGNVSNIFLNGNGATKAFLNGNEIWGVNNPIPPTNNLLIDLDAGNVNSYPGSGSTWINLVDNTQYTIINGAFDSNNGGSIVFNGSSTYVPIGNPLSNGANYTMESWVNASILGSGRNIISSLSNVFWVNNTTLSGGNGGSYSLVTSSNFPTNVWRHVVLTFNDQTNTMTLYINGAQVNQNTSVSTSFVSETLRIGSHYFNGSPVSFWNGKISKVKIYNTELSSASVLENFNLNKSIYGL